MRQLQREPKRLIRDIAVRTLCALSSLPACALDTEGYLRAGTGKEGAPERTCYDLAISGGHYRLGNECDFYGELGLTHAFSAYGANHRAMAMVNLKHPGRDDAAWSAQLEQLYVESSGFGGTARSQVVGSADPLLWPLRCVHPRHVVRAHGRRRFRRRRDRAGRWQARGRVLQDGGGLRRGPAGHSVGSPRPSPEPRPARNRDSGEAGTLRVTTAFTRGHDDATTGARGTSGFALSVQHDRAWEAIGGSHTAWLQFAQGSAGPDANFGTMTASSQVRQWRLIESLTWQSGALGGQMVALFGRHGQDVPNGVAAPYAELSIGGRVSYAVAPHVKLVAESGYMEKRPDGSATQRLAKLTFAPTWSTGPGFRTRPDLRLYVTAAQWNDAANAAAGPDGLSGLGDGRTRGTSWGVQLETWFQLSGEGRGAPRPREGRSGRPR